MRILIVDDSRSMRLILKRMLAEMGHAEVAEAEDGSVALAQMEAFRPELALVDWNMPVMNGLDFLRALRREEGGKKPLVLFCSIETDAEHINEAIRSGADEFIMKPFDAEILESKFAEVGLV